jgi:hypothetical protein
MSRYDHPVAGADLQRSPEMLLRFDSEEGGREKCADEGQGVGFDDVSPDAYAERWTDVTGKANSILGWYEAQLLALGWHPARPEEWGHGRMHFGRDPDERISVWLIPEVGTGDPALDATIGEAEPNEWVGLIHQHRLKRSRSAHLLRVTMAVAGTFPDGRTGQRIG